MSQVQAVIKEKVDKIYILKDNRILIYKKDQHTLCVMNNQNTFMKEIKLELNNKLDDLIILSNGNIVISIGESVYIYKIDKKDFKLIQKIKLEIKKRGLRSFYDYGEEFIPDFTKAKCCEYKNGKYLLILKRIPIDDSKYGLYNYSSIIDIFSLKKEDCYSFTKSIKFPLGVCGRMLYNNYNNYLIIHGVVGSNPMTTGYVVYLFDLENQKEKKLNSMSFFNEKHKLYFISNNKVLHYYIDFNKCKINIYDLENNKESISKTIENKNNYKIEYLYNNEKYIYFYLVKKKNKYEKEELIPDNELTFYKYNFNFDLIEEAHCPYNAKFGYNNIIKIKPNLLILYGLNEMVILKGENSLDNKKEKNMLSEIFE